MQTGKKSKSLIKTVLNISGITMISRVLGVIRDIFMASILGAGLANDLFIFANRIPNLFRRLFAEGAFSQAFLPVIAETYRDHDISETKKLIANVSGLMLIGLSIFTILGVLFSPIFVLIFGNGWLGTSSFNDASSLLRITFPYIFFISLCAISGSILNMLGKYSIMAFSPVILNITMIFAAYFFAIDSKEPAYVFAGAVFFGGLFQLILQIPFLIKYKMLVMPTFNLDDSRTKKVFRLMATTIIASSASQINMMINVLVATFLVTGSLSYLYYAERLIELPIGVFGIALATVALPSMIKALPKGSSIDSEEFRFVTNEYLQWGARLICLVAIPSAIGLMLLGGNIIDVLFGHGKFTEHDVANTSKVLFIFAFSIVSSMLVKLFTNAFLSRQDAKTPMHIAIYAIGINILINLSALVYGYWVLAVGTTVASIFNAVALYYKLKADKLTKITSSFLVFLIKILVATIVMIWVVKYYYVPFTVTNGAWGSLSTFIKLTYLLAWIAGATLVYFSVLGILNVKISSPAKFKAGIKKEIEDRTAGTIIKESVKEITGFKPLT